MCHPYAYLDLTNTPSVSRRVIIYVVPVIIFSFCLNLPKFVETEIVYNSVQAPLDYSMLKNGSIGGMDILFTLLQHADNRFSYKMTSLRNNPHYIR